ncbi:MAG TPA: hypothetical protein VG323_14130 [Thermoanaerobaculia bacterium]|nr:hypothetical protein [Thermoanaerobaculia bacterium]
MTRVEFAWRVARHVSFAFAIVAVALGMGIVGYRYIARFSWIDSLLNASMILGGMGPVGEIKTDAGKIFASAYALFAGLVFIGVSGMLLAPFVHRIMHRFHLDEGKK